MIIWVAEKEEITTISGFYDEELAACHDVCYDCHWNMEDSVTSLGDQLKTCKLKCVVCSSFVHFFSRSSSFVHRIKWINNGPLDAQNHSTQYYLRLALAQNNQPTATTQWHTLSVVIFIWLIQSILAWKPNWHTMISKALYQRPSGNLDRDPTLNTAGSESFANEFKTLTAKQFWLIWDKDQPLWFLSNRNDRLRNSFEQSWKWTTKMASNL